MRFFSLIPTYACSLYAIGICSFLNIAADGQRDDDPRAAHTSLFDVYAPAVRLDDSLGDGKAHACP
jgi:nitrogen fixation-related uncharacterized protein